MPARGGEANVLTDLEKGCSVFAIIVAGLVLVVFGGLVWLLRRFDAGTNATGGVHAAHGCGALPSCHVTDRKDQR